MNHIKNIIVFGCVTALLGCSAMRSRGPSFELAPEAKSDNVAVLYIYRVGAYPTLRAPDISVDGRAIFSPSEEDYTWVYVPKGKHYVKLDWAWDAGWPDVDFVVDLTDRKEFFLKITGSYAPNGDGTFEAGSIARVISPEDAKIELKHCCGYRKPAVNEIEPEKRAGGI
jgi:hypothetical protein